jgi:hypothetical protein
MSNIQQDILLGVCVRTCLCVFTCAGLCCVHVCMLERERERERERMAVSVQADKTFSCSQAAGVCDDMVWSTEYCK